MNSQPQIKFKETLQSLVEESAFKTNRKPIWQSVHITSAALSQYLLGQTRPRLETLVGLAQFFGVSLDYLILGADDKHKSVQASPFNSYVEQALLDVQTTLGARTWIAARIGQELAMQIEKTAMGLNEAGAALDGIVTEQDILVLEQHSLETLILANTLSPNVGRKETGELSVGRFTNTLAQNLNSSPVHGYQFLLPEEIDIPWEEEVHQLRTLLANGFGVTQERLRRCRFRMTSAATFNAAVFYRLNVGDLHHNEPVFAQMVSPYISGEGWIGFAAHVNTTTNNVLFSLPSLERGLSNFKRHWKEAKTEL